MTKKKAGHPIIVWADASQEQLLRDAVASGGLRMIGVGSDQSATAASLASAFGCERINDLRVAAQRSDASLLWIAAPLSLDETTLKLIRQSQHLVAVNQPQPGSVGHLSDVADVLRTIHSVPLMRRSPGYRGASDLLAEFGKVHCVNVSFRSGPGDPALYSRLFDAMDLILSLCGAPEIIDSALALSSTGKPESLAALDGHMTMNLRFTDDRCACIAISNRAGAWFRGVNVLGENGCLRISDGGFEWRTAGGEIIDSHHEEETLTPGSLCGLHLQRLIEQRDTGDTPLDIATLLAMCEAARLSSRTGEGEEPRKILQMLSRP